MMLRIFYELGSPPHFYRIADKMMPWLAVTCIVGFAVGLVLALWFAPPDFRQGDAYRIIFVHVPAAWMSMFVYTTMAVMAVAGLVWKTKMAGVLASASAPIGAVFTFLALATGSIWGKPMWGTWWTWDARLTSELILLFIYLGFIVLQTSIADHRVAWRAGAVLLIVGFVNIPIIHYSVYWWHTLHQPATIAKIGAPSMHPAMLVPLLIMMISFMLFHVIVLLLRAQTILIERERGTSWMARLVGKR